MRRAVVLGVAVAVLGPVAAEAQQDGPGVLYCTEREAAGLSYEDEYRRPRTFSPWRYTVRVSGNWDRLIVQYPDQDRPWEFVCRNMGDRAGAIRMCVEGSHVISINTQTLAFTSSWNIGPLASTRQVDGDTLRVSIGRCTRF